MANGTLTQPGLLRALNFADVADKAAALLNLGLVNAQGDLVTEGLIPGTGTAAELASTVGAVGEILYATDTRKLAIGDGTTAFAALPWANADAHNLTVLSTTATLALPDSTADIVRYTVSATSIGGGTLTIQLPHANALGQRVQVAVKTGFRSIVLQNPFVALDYGVRTGGTQVGIPSPDAATPGTNSLGTHPVTLEYVVLSTTEAVVTISNLATADFDAWVTNNAGGA